MIGFSEFICESGKDLHKTKEVLSKLSSDFGNVDVIGVKTKNGSRGMVNSDLEKSATGQVYKIDSRLVMMVKWSGTSKPEWFVYKSKNDFKADKMIGIRSKDYADLKSKIED